VVAELCLSPLCPDEVSTALGAWLLLLVAVFFFVVELALANETLCLLAVPPTPALDNLPDRGVVVALAHIKFEVVAAKLGLDPFVAIIEHLVHFLHQPDINCKQKVGFLKLRPVQLHAVALRNRYIEVFEQVDDGLLLKFQFLFEQAHHDLVDLVNGDVDDVLPHMFELA